MIIEVMQLDWHKVRAKCIEKDWYTCGTNEQYSRMLDMTEEDYSIELLEKMAENIYDHSNPNRWEGYDGNPILNIMFELAADCRYSFFEEV